MITDSEVLAVYKTAPQNLKEYVDSDDVFNAFHEIRKAYNLHVDHAGNLATIINAVVLGMRPFEEMPQLLREALQGVDDATRDKVLTDINEKIFVPLRNLSKKHAEEVIHQRVAQPKLRTVEIGLSQTPEVVAPKLQISAEPSTPTPAPVVIVTPAPSVPTPPIISVVEQKLSTTNAPQTTAQQVRPEPAPNAPVKYHGSDPYKEPIE